MTAPSQGGPLDKLSPSAKGGDPMAVLPGDKPAVLPGVTTVSAPNDLASGRLPSYLLVVMVTLITAATAFLSVFFLPWRVGSFAVPWILVVGGGVVFWACAAGYRLTKSLWWAALPVFAWLVVAGWLSRSVVLGYVTMLPDWRGQLLLVVGALAGAVALGLAWGSKTLDRTRDDRPPGPLAAAGR